MSEVVGAFSHHIWKVIVVAK